MREFHRISDARAMLDLVLAAPDDNVHVVDLPYRLCSWALDEPENVALWESRGRLAGWAVLQTPFWTIDVAVRPDAEASILPRALEWADARAAAAARSPYGLPTWYVNVFGDQGERIRVLEAAGYACQADVGEDSWSRVLLRRTGHAPLPMLPPGFRVRPLRGREEVAAYVELHQAAFETKNMTTEWRARALDAPHHEPETDLVVEAPDGRLAGFCVGWLSAAPHRTGHIEPLGTRAEFRGLGLGAALLAECVRRLVMRGARHVLVETDTHRAPALELYESLGFRPFRDVLVYRKDSSAGASCLGT